MMHIYNNLTPLQGITGVNEQAALLLGYNSSELLSEELDVIFEQNKHDVKALVRDLFRRGDSMVRRHTKLRNKT